MRYIIYKITNLINGKIYIGKHRCKKLDDSYFGSGSVLQDAIRQYGKENFIFHLEFELHNQEEMDLLERYVVIREFVESRNNYNVSIGGPNCILYGENAPFFGHHHTEESKRLLSESHKGWKMSEEQKEQIRQTLKQKYIDHPELRDAQKFTEGKVVVNKDGKNYFMKENEIPYNEGYVRGSHTKKIKEPKTLLSKEQKRERFKKRNELYRKRKWYNSGKEERWLLPEEVTDGYVLGRLKGINVGRKFSEGTKLKMKLSHTGKTSSNKGQIFITNGIENKYIDSNLPIPKGWKRGITRNKNKGK